MFNRKCKITFIAHGATVYSEENRLSDNGSYPPLSEAGQQEIETICAWLKRRGIKNDKIYSSPALRTTQSAQMISKLFRKDFEILPELTPRKYGVWSGLTFEQIEAKYPKMLENMHANPCCFCPKNGETATDFNKRVAKLIKKIVKENTGNRIIIVTYPDVIQAAISSAIKLPCKHQAKIYVRTGSATQISYFGKWSSLVYSGCVPH